MNLWQTASLQSLQDSFSNLGLIISLIQSVLSDPYFSLQALMATESSFVNYLPQLNISLRGQVPSLLSGFS